MFKRKGYGMSLRTSVIVQYEKGGALQRAEAVIPEPSGHDVIVEISATGVCHSQLFYMAQERVDPMVFGHEAFGHVVSVGSRVKRVQVGQSVIVSWIPATDHLRNPKKSTVQLSSGDTATCANVFTWAEHTIVDELYVAPVSDRVRPELAAVVGCAVATGAGTVRNILSVEPGSSVAVVGLGGVGLAAVAAARDAGAGSILGIDIDDRKLEFSVPFGVTETINSRLVDPVGAVMSSVGGADYVIDCVGSDDTLSQSLALTRPGKIGDSSGGSVALVGLQPSGRLNLDSLSMILGEKSIKATYGGGSRQSDFGVYIDWNERGVLDLDRMVTRVYSMDETSEAVADLDAGSILGRSVIRVS